MVSPQTRTRTVRKVFMARIILAPNENHSGAPRRRHRDRGGRGHVRAPGGGLRPREDPHAAADHGAGVAGARGDEAPVPRGRRRALRRRRPRDHARGRLAALGDGRLGRRAAGEVLRRHALAPRRSRRDRSRRHPRELRGHVPRPRGQPGGAGPRAAGPARPLRPRPRAARRRALRRQGRDPRRRRAHRALRVRAGAAAQAARARRQDHVRDEVERAAADRRPVPPGRRGNRPHVSRAGVRALPRRRRRAADRPVPDHAGRRRLHEPVRRHPVRRRGRGRGRPRRRALRELRRQRLGVLRVGARLGARHRGPRHRQPDGHAAVGRPHARASRARVGGGAPGGGRRARLSRRQDAHAGSARDGDHDTDGGGRARRVSQPMTPAARALAVLVALVLLGATTAAAQPSGTVTFGAHVTLATRWVDPADTDAEITPFMIFYALHDALVKPMPGGLNTPSLAESWTMSSDGRTWEFVLRKGVRFHNGEPVTAEDVKFSFERYKGAASPILKERVREVQVVDPGRVRFHLKDPWPDFMTFYGTSASGAAWIVPKKYVEKVGDDGFKKAPVGAGPYKFVSFTPGVELVLEAFDGYWRKGPSVKRLILKSIPDESTRAAALKRGDIDVTYLLNGPIAADVRRTPGLTLTAMRTNGVLWVEFPEQWTQGSPWADRRVRAAASHAIDRQAINEAEALGYSGPTGNIVPRHQEFSLAIEPHPYDPKRAKALLAEAGYANGFDAGDLTPFPPYNGMGEAIANYFAAVGIRTRLRTMERAALLSAWRDHKLRGVFVGATGSAGNGSTRLQAFATSKGGFTYGTIPEVGSLFARQIQEMDRKKREEMLHQIQRILADRVTFAPIWENGFIRAFGPRVEESGLTLIQSFPYSAPLEDVRLKKQ